MEELEHLLCKNGSSSDKNCVPMLLSTSDPLGMRLGSGGGTVAAIDFSDKRFKSCFEDGKNHSLLIVYAGGNSSRCPTQMVMGKAWTSLPITDPSSGKEVSAIPIFS